MTFEDIVDNLSEGVIGVGPDLVVRVFNQASEKMTEVSRSMIIGRPIHDFFKKESRLVEMIEKTIGDGRLYSEYEENMRRRFSSAPLQVGITTKPVFDEKGVLTGAVALLRDLSGIKSLEADSIKKDRLAYIGTFAASLAHEIRNPLSGIRGAAQLLSKKVKDEHLNEYMRVIIKEADRLNLILNEMLDFSRPARLDIKEVNIHKVLDSVVLLLHEEGHTNPFARVYDPSLPPLLADENQLTQVFLNLVKNAKEALGTKGHIQLTTRMVTDFQIIGTGTKGGKMACVEIKDNGCGIRPEDIEKIFTPFFTTKAKGNGLGMAISLKIIKDHGGNIKIESTAHEGTTVTVTLPLASGEKNTAPDKRLI